MTNIYYDFIVQDSSVLGLNILSIACLHYLGDFKNNARFSMSLTPFYEHFKS